MKKAFTTCFVLCAVVLMVLTFPVDRARAQKDRRVHVPPVRREEETFVPGRVLVKFRSNVGLDHARQIIAALGVRDAEELPAIGVFVLELPEQANEAAFANAMQGRPEVEFAELDRIVKPEEITPNDPWYANWQWHLPKISAPAAWSVTTGDSSIIIAILDSGVNSSHEDLAAKIVPGWNTYSNNSDTNDLHGHGTNGAGAAAALGNNGRGVASVAWGCKIMPIRVTGADAGATYLSLANGLIWAADHGARVANMSFMTSDNATVKSAAQYFQNHGGVVTSSAGNYGSFVSSPDNPYILTISATDRYDMRSGFSNYGNIIDLAAPESGYSTALGGDYTYASGTSFSAPLVAGVAALVLSVNPGLTGKQVQDILKLSADDLGPAGFDTSYGWGRINAARAVQMARGNSDTALPTVVITSPSTGATVSGTVTVEVSASDNVGVSFVSVDLDGASKVSMTSSPYMFQWDTTTAKDGLHSLTAIATDSAGNSTSSTIMVTVKNSVIDIMPPNVLIISPSDGTRISTNVSVSVNATDNVGVVRNELYIDGVLTSASTTAPFTTKWNSRKAAYGAHWIYCKAYDAAGNTSVSQIATVYK
jgi:thermitase